MCDLLSIKLIGCIPVDEYKIHIYSDDVAYVFHFFGFRKNAIEDRRCFEIDATRL